MRSLALARKPNFDFERREREKAKAAKMAEKAKAKSEKKTPSEPGDAASADEPPPEKAGT